MKNPIWSILFLIILFAFISLYLIILGLEFIGLSYLIVYVGAVSILFLFILMLINIRVSELKNYTNNSIPLIIIMLLIFNNIFFQVIPFINILFKDIKIFLNINEIEKYLFLVSSKSWDSNLLEMSHITSIGNVMYTNYNIWLFITSLILLVAMVGTIVITMKPVKHNWRN
jgi:NADH-ubiquinone oxidoreductase chain 6